MCVGPLCGYWIIDGENKHGGRNKRNNQEIKLGIEENLRVREKREWTEQDRDILQIKGE